MFICLEVIYLQGIKKIFFNTKLKKKSWYKTNALNFFWTKKRKISMLKSIYSAVSKPLDQVLITLVPITKYLISYKDLYQGPYFIAYTHQNFFILSFIKNLLVCKRKLFFTKLELMMYQKESVQTLIFLITSTYHNLRLNPSKSSALVFGTWIYMQFFLSNLNITLNGCLSPICNHIKYHVFQTLRRSYTKLKMLYASRYVLTQKLKLLLSDSLILSNFNYCVFLPLLLR